MKEFGRRANSMTYDKGAGYLFGTGYDGITLNLGSASTTLNTNTLTVRANTGDFVFNGAVGGTGNLVKTNVGTLRMQGIEANIGAACGTLASGSPGFP